jgi:hypothetical protein
MKPGKAQNTAGAAKSPESAASKKPKTQNGDAISNPPTPVGMRTTAPPGNSAKLSSSGAKPAATAPLADRPSFPKGQPSAPKPSAGKPVAFSSPPAKPTPPPGAARPAATRPPTPAAKPTLPSGTRSASSSPATASRPSSQPAAPSQPQQQQSSRRAAAGAASPYLSEILAVRELGA